MTETNTVEAKQRARAILASRGWFPSAGSVPYDVALQSIIASEATAIERAAELAEKIGDEPGYGGDHEYGWQGAGISIATAIRALKDTRSWPQILP